LRTLVLAATQLKRDARIQRQIGWLSSFSKVTCVADNTTDTANAEFITIESSDSESLLSRRSRKAFREAMFWSQMAPETWYWSLPWVSRAYHRLRDNCTSNSFDIIIANDLITLPLALKIAHSTPVVFDAHEYYPQERPADSTEQRIRNQYAEQLCVKYMPRAAAVATVSNGVASLYQQLIGVKASVVPNFPEYKTLHPSPSEGDPIRLIHHGGYHADRHLEELVLATRLLGKRATLDFMLVDDSRKHEVSKLRQMAKDDDNITFRHPVRPEDVCTTINHYDVGVYLLPPNCLNNQYALPNKFFDFIQARLATVIGPSSEMASIINQYNLGLVADDFSAEALASQIESLSSAEIMEMKQHAHIAANALCSQEAEKRWNEVIHGVA
jgi:hypothetical protein